VGEANAALGWRQVFSLDGVLVIRGEAVCEKERISTLTDKPPPTAIFDLALCVGTVYHDRAMVAHTEPVNSWGHKPCGEFALRSLPVSRWGGGAPRPPGNRRGRPEVQTLLFSASDSAYGGRYLSAGLAERNAHNEPSPSQAAASSAFALPLAPSDEGSHCGGASCLVREVLTSLSRLNDALGTAST